MLYKCEREVVDHKKLHEDEVADLKTDLGIKCQTIEYQSSIIKDLLEKLAASKKELRNWKATARQLNSTVELLVEDLTVCVQYMKARLKQKLW